MIRTSLFFIFLVFSVQLFSCDKKENIDTLMISTSCMSVWVGSTCNEEGYFPLKYEDFTFVLKSKNPDYTFTCADSKDLIQCRHGLAAGYGEICLVDIDASLDGEKAVDDNGRAVDGYFRCAKPYMISASGFGIDCSPFIDFALGNPPPKSISLTVTENKTGKSETIDVTPDDVRNWKSDFEYPEPYNYTYTFNNENMNRYFPDGTVSEKLWSAYFISEKFVDKGTNPQTGIRCGEDLTDGDEEAAEEEDEEETETQQ